MSTRILLRVADTFFAFRPLILIPAWSFYALGLGSTGLRSTSATALVQPGFWCMTAVLASSYALNQIFDEDSDRLNDKGFHLTRGLFRARTMVVLAFLAFTGASLLYQTVPATQTTVLVVTLLLSFGYSLPPLRLCARPWLDLAANALGYGGLAFALGVAGQARLFGWADFAHAFVPASPWILLVAATFLHTTIMDIDGDAAAGKRTTSVVIGVRGSAWLAAVLAGGSVAAAALRFLHGENVSATLILAFALAIFVAAAVGITRAARRTERGRVSSATVQAVTTLVVLNAAWRDPWLLALVLPVVVAARYYYRARFGLRYPG